MIEPLGCPRCRAPLPPCGDAMVTCTGCGTAFVMRRLQVEALSARKIAGVERRRYRLRPAGGADELSFDGPAGLAVDPGTTATVLFRDGSPVLVSTPGQAAPLLVTASAEGSAGEGRPPLAAALLWVLGITVLLLLAALLDTGTEPLRGP